MKEKNYDLHCHLDGSLNPRFLAQVSGIQDPKKLFQMIRVQGEQCMGLSEYLTKFDLPIQCLADLARISQAAEMFAVSLQQDHIGYCEVRFSPVLLVRENQTIEQILESVLHGLKNGSEKTGIELSVILCAMRHHTPDDNIRVFDLAAKYLGNGVCAVDLAGDESRYPNAGFGELFAYAKQKGLPFTIHAGECGNAQSIADAIEYGAKRIGHGIAMKGDKDLQKLCAEKNVAVEMCPISNLQTRAVESVKDYPIREFLENEIPVTINTDNRTVSNTSITKEYQFLRNNLNISENEIQMMRANSAAYRFKSI